MFAQFCKLLIGKRQEAPVSGPSIFKDILNDCQILFKILQTQRSQTNISGHLRNKFTQITRLSEINSDLIGQQVLHP